MTSTSILQLKCIKIDCIDDLKLCLNVYIFSILKLSGLSRKTTGQDFNMKESTTSFIEATNDDVGATDEKSLVRKIDMHLMPTLWLMFFWSYIDRTNIGNAKIGGMEEDLHLTSGQYSLSLIVFLVTYILAEIPSK